MSPWRDVTLLARRRYVTIALCILCARNAIRIVSIDWLLDRQKQFDWNWILFAVTVWCKARKMRRRGIRSSSSAKSYPFGWPTSWKNSVCCRSCCCKRRPLGKSNSGKLHRVGIRLDFLSLWSSRRCGKCSRPHSFSSSFKLEVDGSWEIHCFSVVITGEMVT